MKHYETSSSEHSPNEIGTMPTLIIDDAPQSITFNVMSDRQVRETLYPREYRLGHRRIVANFDRQYTSEMLNSPDHLIFLTALIQLQKMVYIYMCKELNLPYDGNAPEVLKIWPTKIETAMPKMITERHRLVHSVQFDRIKSVGPSRYFARTRSDICGLMTIDAEAMIFVL